MKRSNIFSLALSAVTSLSSLSAVADSSSFEAKLQCSAVKISPVALPSGGFKCLLESQEMTLEKTGLKKFWNYNPQINGQSYKVEGSGFVMQSKSPFSQEDDISGGASIAVELSDGTRIQDVRNLVTFIDPSADDLPGSVVYLSNPKTKEYIQLQCSLAKIEKHPVSDVYPNCQ